MSANVTPFFVQMLQSHMSLTKTMLKSPIQIFLQNYFVPLSLQVTKATSKSELFHPF